MWMVTSWEGEGGNWGKSPGIKYKQEYNRQGDIKNRIGNGEAKELLFMTHGHELSGCYCWREWQVLGGGGQSGKNWDKKWEKL